MLALLVYIYANGIFSSLQSQRATYRNIAVRFVTANFHPDHDTIAILRRSHKATIKVAFVHVMLFAWKTELLRLAKVSIDGTKIDANASKIPSVRHDCAQQLRTKFTAAIAGLMAQAKAANAEGHDPQALQAKLTWREPAAPLCRPVGGRSRNPYGPACMRRLKGRIHDRIQTKASVSRNRLEPYGPSTHGTSNALLN